MACMVCKRCEVRLFNVGSNYGKINHTVGDDLIEIYGEQVRLFLTPDSCVCNVCMNMLDTITKLKRSIWSVVSDPCSQPSKLYKFYKLFASLKLEGDDLEDEQLQDSNNRTPTPKLLAHAYSVPYNENLEVQLAERERIRSLSRSSSYFARSTSDTSEVQNILSKRKRKKTGHNWTRRKGAKSRATTSRSRSLTSRIGKNSVSRYRNSSPCSDYSYSTSYTRHSSIRTAPSTMSIVKRERLSTTWTRSVSRAHEEENRNNLDLLLCTVDECRCGCYDIDEMNQHNIEEHQMLPLHFCQECQDAFTSLELLRLHMANHDTSSLYCLMCGVEQNNSRELQQHLDEHMLYSVPCKFCDKSFLNKSVRENHVTKCHKTRRKRRTFNEKLILDRIDKSDGEEDEEYFSEDGYQARYFYYTDMECEEGDIEPTIENFKIHQIPIYTDEDAGITADGFGLNINIDDSENVNPETTEQCSTEIVSEEVV